MRKLVSLLSCCALLIAQTPFSPCPAAASSEISVTPLSTTGVHARHAHTPDAAPHAQSAVVQDADPPATALTQAAPAQHDGFCSMLTRCDWVAVPTEPDGSAPTLHFGSAAGTAFTDVPAASEPFVSTPPPRPIS